MTRPSSLTVRASPPPRSSPRAPGVRTGFGGGSSPGRSTLDQKKRTEIYAKIQRLVFDDAAYLFKWGLHGVWGISNRVEYQAPRDEIDRMFLVTPRPK